MKRRYIFDAGPLITLCKFSVQGRPAIDIILDACEVVIPEKVRDEVVIAGERYPDAKVAQDRISNGQIQIAKPRNADRFRSILDLYNFGEGEKQAICLADENDFDSILIVDDHLAYLVCDRLALDKLFLLDLIVLLCLGKHLEVELGRSLVSAIASRYPPAFVQHTLLELEGAVL